MKKLKKKKNKFSLILAIIVAFFCCVLYIMPGFTSFFTQSYNAKYGRLKLYDDTRGYLVRTEKVYVSNNSGTMGKRVPEGTLVRKNEKILGVSGEAQEPENRDYKRVTEHLGKGVCKTSSFRTIEEGIVSYKIDGYEVELTPNNMADYNEAYYSSLEGQDFIELNHKKIAPGDPVFKISDRARWYIVCFVPRSHKDRYYKGKRVQVRLQDEKTIRGMVDKVSDLDGKTRIIISTNNYYQHFAETRACDIRIVTCEGRGLVIQDRSIIKKDGYDGVYVKQNTGKYKFVRIKVLLTDGERSIVSKGSFEDEDGKIVETIKNYDEIRK